ncbi:MAG: 4Fe-4S binding protein [Bacillota bacterium]
MDEWCEGCGRCVETCPQKALSIKDGKAIVNQDVCVFCGYCGSACRDFYIKVV